MKISVPANRAGLSPYLGRISLAALAAGMVALPGAALAQAENQGRTQSSPPLGTRSDASSLEEVVVTARKRSERLRDIPTAGTAIGADLIRELGGVPTAQSLLSNTPGVNFANTSNPVTSEVSIRGSGTSRATNAESGVGLFRDGAFIGGGTVGGRTFTNLDLFDAERIEVLRGVQGGLNGRNAEGGSVNVVSARPTHKFEGFGIATIGNNEREEVQLVTNIPINEQWAFRLGADVMDQAKGFYHFYLSDNYADRQQRQFVRGQLNFKSGNLTANLLAEHGFEQLQGLTYRITQLPSATYPQGYVQDRFELPWDTPSKGKQQVNNIEFTANYDFGFADLSTTSMYRVRNGNNIYDRDASSATFVRQLVANGLVAPASVNTVLAGDYNLIGDQGDVARITYQDVHLTGRKIGNFQWLVGGEYYGLEDRPYSVLGRTPTVANPSPGTIDRIANHFESYAFYGSGGYDLTRQLNLSADLRVTTDDQTYRARRLDIRTQLPSSAAFSIDGTRGGTNVSYTVTLGYKPSSNMLLYGKVGSAYRSGNFNTSQGDPRQPVTPPLSFDDETVTAYEVGFKGNLLPNVYIAAAAYRNEFDNLVIQGDNGCANTNPVCPVQQTVFAFNAGPASLYGFEIEATSRFDLFGGPLRLTVGASHQGGEITGGIYNGRRQPQQPDYTLTFNTNYRHDLGHDILGFINIKGSGRFGGVQEVAQVPLLNDFVLVDGRLGVERGPYEFAFYAENLFDESYIVFDAITPTGSTSRFNLPRNYGIQLRYTW